MIVLTLLARDEQDVIGTNVAYHLAQGVDHIIATDNRSVDATRSILERFAASGRLTLLDEDGDDHSQHVWVTRMARMAAAMGATWVINCDADEFWWPQNGTLPSLVASFPPECGSIEIARANFLPLRNVVRDPVAAMRYRQTRGVNALGQSLPGKAMHRAASDVFVAPGNHSVRSPKLGPPENAANAVIFHFPYRSFEQFSRKIANGGAALARNTELPKSVGATWRALYERLQDGTLRAWYDRLPHGDDPDVPKWLASGDVVDDPRLAQFLARTCPS